MNSSSKPDKNKSKNKPTLATNEEVEQPCQDFISALPDDLLLLILSKLETGDAAITMLVSKRWAPLFPTLPSLIIDDDFLTEVWNKDPIEWFHALIDILGSRRAPIKTFLLSSHNFGYGKHYYDKAISDVCAAGVEELAISDVTHIVYKIPPSVFACDTITNLEISCCVLVVPSKMTGLRSVKSLELNTVEVVDDDLQRMISQCKALEKLVITDCCKVKNIVVCAPNLSQLVIELNGPVGIVLKSVPQLAYVSISFIDEEFNGRVFKIFKAANLTNFLNGLRGVKDLRLDFDRSCADRMILSNEGMVFPTMRSPKSCLIKLRKLCLHLPINYHASNLIISCLLNSSPHLTEVIICDGTRFFYHNYCLKALELNFWKEQVPAECVKHHLTTATFYWDENISEDCFVFPKFLLLNAANLKKMDFLFYYRNQETISKTEEKIRNGILGTQMAFPDVEIMIKPTNRLGCALF